VVGSPAELGVWNASESTCSLEWTQGDLWVGNLTISPGPVEFKLVQVSDEEVIWPEGGFLFFLDRRALALTLSLALRATRFARSPGNNVSLLIPDQASGVDVTGEGDSLNLTILGNSSSGAEERSREVQVEREEVNETPSGGGTPFFPTSAGAGASAGQSSGVEFETLEIGRLEDMTVAELKKLLKARALPVSGKKAELIERLCRLE